MTANGLTVGRISIVHLTDGSSNTLLVAESAGRHQVYARNRLTSAWALNASYFDYNATIQVRGFSNDGLVPDGGCCVINCTNGGGAAAYQMYSFHTGGMNALRGDGSVQFIRDSVAPAIVAALVSRNGQEVNVNID
jgi:prepilin-type processing-associated H-X9-DG protein